MEGFSLRRDRPVILIVDDDLTLRILVRESLEQAGFEVEERADGVEAIGTFEEFNRIWSSWMS